MLRLATSAGVQMGLLTSWSNEKSLSPVLIPIKALVTLLAMLQLRDRVDASYSCRSE